jgi:hypothetical protein
MLRFLLAFCLLTGISFAEVNVSVVKTTVLSGVKTPEVILNYVLFDSEGSTPKFEPAAKISIDTKAKFVKVIARKTLFESADVVKLKEHEFLLVGSGKYALEVTTFDPELGIDEKTVSIELGPSPNPEPGPGPTPPDPTPPDPTPPDPTPTPDIPSDQFNDLGKRVATTTLGFPLKLEVAKVYREGAKELRENPSVTVNSVFDFVFNKRVNVLGASNIDKWKPFVDLLNADLRPRWPMARLVVAEYLDTIALGLERSQ